MKLYTAALLASTVIVPAGALAQATTPSTQPQAAQAQPAQTGMQAPAAAEFVTQAANGNMFEIRSSQVALEKTQNEQIRQFAQKMVQDHTGAGERLKEAAQGQTVPTDLDQQHAQMLQQLQGASGPDFDRRYVQLQLAAHQDSVLLFEKYGQNGDNPQLKQFAQQMLPDLQAHLQQVQQIRSALPPEPVAQGLSTSQQTAQAPAAPMTAPAGASAGPVLTTMQPGHFRASKLIGLNIYGSEQGNRNDTDKIGDINEVIVDRTGNIQAVVIGVGGFLGIGEKDVAIPFNQIEWRTSEEVRTSTNTAAPTAAGGTAARTDTAAPGATATAPAGRPGDASTTGTVARSDQAGANQATPDRGYIRMSKADLQNAPTFRYDARDAGRSTQPSSTIAPTGSTAPATRP